MNQIQFSHNWNNKLECELFTTIRGSTPDKVKWYKSVFGSDFEVVLKGEVHSIARFIDMRLMKLSEVDRTVLMSDIGYFEKDKVF